MRALKTRVEKTELKGIRKMSEISCTAHTCAYNSDSYCVLNAVRVSGQKAKKSCDTACESFYLRNPGAVNACCPEMHLPADNSIECNAEKCMYNQSGRCKAAAVDINGIGADVSSRTECGTFVKK